MMEPPQKPGANLFQVYLRLRPTPASQANADRFLAVEEPEEDEAPSQITLNPPNDRRRAVEKFAFTRVFEDDATQLDLFQGTRVLPLLEGVLAPHGSEGTDGLLATLGTTGSGKTHTMLGSRSQRGLTQLALDVIFRSVESNILDCSKNTNLEASIQASDPSEATFFSAPAFLEAVYNDFASSRTGSRAGTPMTVRGSPNKDFVRTSLQHLCPQLPGMFPESPNSMRLVRHEDDLSRVTALDTPPRKLPGGSTKGLDARANANSGKPKLATASPKKHYMSLTSAAESKKNVANTPVKSDFPPPSTPRPKMQRPSTFPQIPNIDSIRASCDPSAEYAILISMYEVYNDRIFDLLTPPIKSNATKEYRRRPLLFKSTEQSPDRKVVAGLRKVICGNLTEALMVLEAGLHERRVAGTGSNSVSSRSHGFFCVEVKKRRIGRSDKAWGGSTLSIVDLAGSERARDAKTQGATLAEAGKINESLMYLGQCLQMQSDMGNTSKPNVVPFRQCKLTELLFSNSFPSPSFTQSASIHRRNPQKGVMIVTADPIADFNATSQILRYSALARTVTVPRVPSVNQPILQPSTSSTISSTLSYPTLPYPQPSPTSSSSLTSPSMQHHRPFFHQPSPPNRMFSPQADNEQRGTMENAALEIARMAEMIDQLNAELSHEQDARIAAEAHLLSMEERFQDLEQEIREECYTDFERRLALEMNRWKATLSNELERGEEHWDRKIEVLARGVGVLNVGEDEENEGEDDKENVLVENLEQENERLRRELAVLKRELGSRTPSRRAPLQERGEAMVAVKSEMAGLGSRMEALRVTSSGSGRSILSDGTMNSINSIVNDSDSSSVRSKKSRVATNGSPTKKVRKLQAKKWEPIADDDI
ncbi:kinesin family protein [Apiospora aurea]|uniref:Kinesin-like protein n=1 Tax=Apiospora aurea TaxID=335848 RepID=A0ABR1Q1D9_9PEZI